MNTKITGERLNIPKNRQIESISKFYVGPNCVRVWMTAETVEQAVKDSEIIRIVPASLTMAQIAEYFASYPGVAAVEVTKDWKGIIIYPDWN